MFYIDHGSETTTWTRPVTRQPTPPPAPPVVHVQEREHKSTRNSLSCFGTTGMVGTLYVFISYTTSIALFIFMLTRFAFSAHPSTTTPYVKS